MADNSEVRTIEDLVKFGKTSDFSPHLISFYSKEKNHIFLSDSVLLKYESIIRDNASWIELSEEDSRRFRFKPDLLSMFIYGTPLLVNLILLLNNCNRATFTRKRLLLMHVSQVEELLNRIILNETARLERNAKEIRE